MIQRLPLKICKTLLVVISVVCVVTWATTKLLLLLYSLPTSNTAGYRWAAEWDSSAVTRSSRVKTAFNGTAQQPTTIQQPSNSQPSSTPQQPSTVTRSSKDKLALHMSAKLPSTRIQTNKTTGMSFRDEYFEPILATFRNSSAFAIKKHFRSGEVPKVFFVAKESRNSAYWTQSFRQFAGNECPLPCIVTDNKDEMNSSDAILIYLKQIKSVEKLQIRLPKRDRTQPWIVHSNETPVMSSNFHLSYKSLDGIFNRTMHFRRDADIAWTHGFIISKEDAKYLPDSWQVEAPPIMKKPFSERKLAVGFISNCSPKGGRQEYIDELSKHIEIDIYGKCGPLKCQGPRHVGLGIQVQKDSCLLEAAKDYLFYLSFENNICEDYVSEKVYNIQYHPVVPIVYGGADYSQLLPPNSYIDALQFTTEQLAKLLKSLAADEVKYEAMLAWRNNYLVSTVAYRRVLCQLCTKLYDPEFYEEKTYDHFHDWFVTKSKCRVYHAATNTTELLKIP